MHRWLFCDVRVQTVLNKRVSLLLLALILVRVRVWVSQTMAGQNQMATTEGSDLTIRVPSPGEVSITSETKV